MTALKHVCVFCGSSMGNRTSYEQAAYNFGVELAKNNMGLVYGAGSTGLMGIIADSVMKHGGSVIGIIPKALVRREFQHTNLTELCLVDTMHERKALMAQRSDAFVGLPGGFGTFEELFEVITWAQLGIHTKPIALLNVDNYFDPLLNLIEHSLNEGFIRGIDPNLLRVTPHAKDVIPLLQEPALNGFRPKWMDIGQT